MAERLAAAGHDVHAFTTFPHYPEWRFVEGEPPRTSASDEKGVHVTRLRHRLPARGSSISRVISEVSFGLRALCRRWHRPEAVVLVSPALFASAVLVPRLWLTRTPFVLWVQDLYGLGIQETSGGTDTGLAARLVARLEGWLARRADSVVAIHEGMAAALGELGVPASRITVSRNWTHIETPARTDRAAERAAQGWLDHETVVLHTGNMGLKQDLQNVVEAARVAERAHRDVRFVLMGDGTERPALELLADGVANVQLLPPQPAEIYERMLQAADVLLVNEHPGLRGMALPSKLTSYFVSGRPVLAATSAESTTAAEIERARAGARVDAGEPELLLRAVVDLVADEPRVASLVRNADRYRREVLSAEAASSRFGAVLQRIVAQRAPKTVDLRVAGLDATLASGTVLSVADNPPTEPIRISAR